MTVCDEKRDVLFRCLVDRHSTSFGACEHELGFATRIAVPMNAVDSDRRSKTDNHEFLNEHENDRSIVQR